MFRNLFCFWPASERLEFAHRGYSLFTTSDARYGQLTRVLVDSLLAFSSHPIHVTVLGGDWQYDHPRVTSTQLRLRAHRFELICYSKMAASVLSPFAQVAQLDSDMVASPDIDLLFEGHDAGTAFPMGALHPQDPNNQAQLSRLLGVRVKSQPYVHATYLVGQEAREFMMSCLDIADWLVARRRFGFGYRPENFDETVLNVNLWRCGATSSYLPSFDPYFSAFVRPHAPNGAPWDRHCRLVAHGLKCPRCASHLFESLVQVAAHGGWGSERAVPFSACTHLAPPSGGRLRALTQRAARAMERRVSSFDGIAKADAAPLRAIG